MSTESPAASPRDPRYRISLPLVAALQERYEIIRETGRGASAIVYLARDLKHERLVALKTLSPDVGPVAGARFLREIQVAAGMQHPHILPMYDSGVADGRLFFVMPFVDGGSLRDRLDAQPQLPADEALRYAHEIAIALAFAHEQGVVHRDIKPENILFYHGHACLADFGVARVMEEMDVRVTGHGMVVGTPAYMSPEQLTDGGFDGRSDVYSLACVLYEMLAGVHAFSGSTPRELLEKRLRTPPEPLRKHRADVPKFVEELLLRALAPRPEGRFSDAHEFARAIAGAQRALIAPRRAMFARGASRLWDSVPRNPAVLVGATALIALVATLAAKPVRAIIDGRGLGRGTPAERARSAIAQWDLPAAERELAAAGESRDPMVLLSRAQLLELQRRVDSDEFRLTVARMMSAKPAAHGRDSLLVLAMQSLAARAYPQACEHFRAMRALDSLDAMAWFGSGDCLALDPVVVPDAKSRSGWRFRASWASAAPAFIRAATLDPRAHRALPFSLFTGLLFTSPSQVRFGREEKSSTTTFGAQGELSGDSAVFVPYSLADIAAARPSTVPPTLAEFVRRQRELLVSFARQWTAAAPSSAEAFEALAAGYETRGELDQADGALGALARARALASTPQQALRLAANNVRLEIKRGDFVRAQALADSILTAWNGRPIAPAEADRLVGLAMLTGRLDLGAKLRVIAQTAANAGQGIPPQLTTAEARLFVLAAAGVCSDSVAHLRAHLDDLLQSYAQPTRRDAIRAGLLSRPMELAFPCLGARAFDGLAPVSPLDHAQHAVAARASKRALAILDSVDALRAIALPGELPLDFTFQESWVRAQAGDTADVIRRLDRVLDALPTLNSWAVREEAQSAAIARTLMFRAELAAARGDTATSGRRARQALELWLHADPVLGQDIARLRRLSGAR